MKLVGFFSKRDISFFKNMLITCERKSFLSERYSNEQIMFFCEIPMTVDEQHSKLISVLIIFLSNDRSNS